eukprot:COSAG04_NODE_15721_length_522_cov_10.501182_2_plen_58_part_01
MAAALTVHERAGRKDARPVVRLRPRLDDAIPVFARLTQRVERVHSVLPGTNRFFCVKT